MVTCTHIVGEDVTVTHLLLYSYQRLCGVDDYKMLNVLTVCVDDVFFNTSMKRMLRGSARNLVCRTKHTCGVTGSSKKWGVDIAYIGSSKNGVSI